MLRIYGGTIIQTIARMNLQLATAQHSWKVKLESVFAGVPLRGQDRLHGRQTDRQTDEAWNESLVDKVPVLHTRGPKFHPRSHSENKNHGAGGTPVTAVLERQRQTDPWDHPVSLPGLHGTFQAKDNTCLKKHEG